MCIVFVGFYLLGALCDIFPLKTHKDIYCLDIITISCDSYKGKSICVSMVSIIMCSIIFLGSNQILIGLGCEDIQVMPPGNYCYYVYATNEKDKTYTLPANIEKVNNDTYLVHNIYFKNGGYLYFGDAADYFDYGEKERHIDQNENFWDIKLTSYKTHHEKVSETKPFNPCKLVLPCISIIIILISTVLYIIRIRTEYI